MKSVNQALVTVLTPVYNGEKYLSECIESVLTQTYNNWEYIIINNCSTDKTLEIAQIYAEEDRRIRIHNNKQFLSAIENHNHAFRLIGKYSSYCKVLHADDLLFPDCLKQMVAVAEANKSIGLVSSYAIHGTYVRDEKVPYPQTFIPGKEACRLSFLTGSYLFGTTPTSVLIRSDIIRKYRNFYNNYPHADLESFFKILQHSDFGFVHQILTYTRVHPEQQSSFANKFNTYIPAYLHVLKKYGPACLTNEEYHDLFKKKLKSYYRFLGNSILKNRGKEFWDYHKKNLEELGHPFNSLKAITSFARITASQTFNKIWPN